MKNTFDVITGTDDGLPSAQYQAIIWTNSDLLPIRTNGIYFNAMLFKI